MVVSNKTAEQIAEVILNHVDRDRAVSIVADLERVQGSQSFRDTIKRVRAILTDEDIRKRIIKAPQRKGDW